MPDAADEFLRKWGGAPAPVVADKPDRAEAFLRKWVDEPVYKPTEPFDYNAVRYDETTVRDKPNRAEWNDGTFASMPEPKRDPLTPGQASDPAITRERDAEIEANRKGAARVKEPDRNQEWQRRFGLIPVASLTSAGLEAADAFGGAVGRTSKKGLDLLAQGVTGNPGASVRDELNAHPVTEPLGQDLGYQGQKQAARERMPAFKAQTGVLDPIGHMVGDVAAMATIGKAAGLQGVNAFAFGAAATAPRGHEVEAAAEAYLFAKVAGASGRVLRGVSESRLRAMIGEAVAVYGTDAAFQWAKGDGIDWEHPIGAALVFGAHAGATGRSILDLRKGVGPMRPTMGGTPTAEETARAVNEAVAKGEVSPQEAFSPERVAVAEDAVRRGQDPATVLENTPSRVRDDGSGTSEGRAGLPTAEALARGLVDPPAVPLVEKMEAEGVRVVSSDAGLDGKGVAIGIAPDGRTVVERGPVEPPVAAVEKPAAPVSESERLRKAFDERQKYEAELYGEDVRPEPKSLREALDTLNSGDNSYTESDLAEFVRDMVDDGGGSKALKKALEKYEKDQSEEYDKWSGRGDMAGAGEALVAAVERELRSGRGKPKAPEPAAPTEAKAVKGAAKPVRYTPEPPPPSLVDWVRAEGGIDLQREIAARGMVGETNRLRLKESGTTGLVDVKGGRGKSWDKMHRAAVEDGMFPEDSTLSEFVQALHEQAGPKVKRTAEERRADEFGYSVEDARRWEEERPAREAEAAREAAELKEEREAIQAENEVGGDDSFDPYDFSADRVRIEPEAPEAPTNPRSRRKEAGAFDITAPLHAVKDLAVEAGSAAKGEFGEFLGRFKKAGSPVANDIGARAEAAVDSKKKFLGDMSAEIDTALKASGGSPLTAGGKAAIALSMPKQIKGKDYATTDGGIHGAIEGKRPARNAEEAAIIEAGRALIDKRGRMFKEVGLNTTNAVSGEVEPFNPVPGGKVAPRISTPLFFDAMMKGEQKSPVMAKVIDAVAEVNNIPRDRVADIFREIRSEMVADGPDATERKTQAEFKRAFKVFPTDVWVNGVRYNILETNPYTYFKRLAETGAARASVVKHFGQNTNEAGYTGETPASLKKNFADETGNVEDFNALMRGLHGQNMKPPILTPGSPSHKAAVAYNTVAKVVKTTMLSSSAIQNIPEPLGNIAAFSGLPTTAKNVARMILQTKSWRERFAQAEALGAITKDIANFSYDPKHPIQSSVRMFSEIVRKTFAHGQVNESQESLSAVNALDMVDAFKAGKGRPIHVQRLVASLGYERPLAERIVSGEATQAEYDAMVRRAPSALVGANTSPAEQGMFEARRQAKAALVFQKYAWMSVRSAANQARTFLTSMNRVMSPSSGLSQGERWSEAYAATRNMAGFIGGKSAQGTVAYMLTSLATGGAVGLKAAIAEMKDAPVDFAVKSFLYSTFGGPISAAVRVASDKDEISNVIFPVFLAKETAKMIGGSEDDPRYRDKGFGERLGEFTKRVLPVYRVGETALTALGFGSPQGKDIDTARRAFYRWKMESFRKGPSFVPKDQTDGGIEFRRSMKAAYEATQAGESPEVVNAHVMRALNITGRDKGNIRASIRGRRLLHRSDVRERLDELKSRIGEDAYKLLELHDTLLDRLASTIKEIKRD